MRIDELLWPHDRIEHIARHGVTPEEVEQVCFSQSLVLRAKSYGDNPVYYVLGQTDAGRVLVFSSHSISRRQRISGDVAIDDRQRRAPLSKVERKMKTEPLPKTDSIQELAQFWDTHDVTDFEDQLEEVSESVFSPRAAIRLELESNEADAVRKMAEAKGVADAELIHSWVREKIGAA